jgi:Dolichyl-phosphate-mannose-protein mannosyltransferase
MHPLPVRRREVLLLFLILAGGIGIRLVAISQPFIDAWSWRQADVAMIAENFYRRGFPSLYPQINWAGAAPGYVGTEFPLVAFIAAMLYGLVGVQDWVGRAVSVFFFAASLPCLYRLVRQVMDANTALWAVGLYSLTPLCIFASRSFMPDMASLSLSIAALYLFARWLERAPHMTLFIAMSLAASLAILIKPPAMLTAVPMLVMAWDKYGMRGLFRWELATFAALSLIGPLAWYTHAYVLSVTHAPYHFFGGGGIEIKEVGWYVRIIERMVTSSLTPIVAAAMLVGLLLPARTPTGWLFHWWVLAISVFVVIAGEGNYRHDWYQLSFVPAAAALGGRACEEVFRRLRRCIGSAPALIWAGLFWAGLAFASYLCLAPYYEPKRLPLWQVGRQLDRITPPEALVLIADNGDPTGLYYSKRHGWHFLQDFGRSPVDSQHAIRELERLRTEGAGYLALTSNSFWGMGIYQAFREHVEARYQRVSETKAYVVFDMRGVKANEVNVN